MIACTPTCRPQLLPQVDEPRVRPGHFVTGYPIYSWTNHVVLFFLRDSQLSFVTGFFSNPDFRYSPNEGRESGLSRVSPFPTGRASPLSTLVLIDVLIVESRLPCSRASFPSSRWKEPSIYSGSTMSGQQGTRMALLGVQKLRVDARIGLLHRSKNNINSSSSIEKLETALLEIWKWPGAVSEKEKERERDKDGGQVKTVSLPGWKKVLAGNGTKWSWSIIKVALIRSKTFFI